MIAWAAAGLPSGWAWHAHPDVWGLIALLIAGYYAAIRIVGPTKVAPGTPLVTARQVACFASGAAILWTHSDWPIHDLSERYLYSVHMVQHTGFTLLAPPLLLLGMPSWMWRWLLVEPRRVHAIVRRTSRPLPAAVLFNVMTVVTHWPFMVDYTLFHHWAHFFVHVVMFAIAVNMWLPVVNRRPELPRPSYPVKMVYLFLMSVIPTIPASFLTFGDTVLYRFYAQVPRPFAISALEDQQLAGALMKVYAGSILWGAIVLLFFRWYTKEQQPTPMPKVLTWEHVEQELQRTDAVN